MSARAVTVAGWVLLAVVLVACEVAARRSKGRLPTFSRFVTRVMAPPALRAVVLVGWMWLGWHAFAR